MKTIRDIANAWAKAWMNQDSEAFVSLFTPDALYRDDQAGRLSRGQAELKAFHQHFAQALSDVCMDFTNVFSEGPNACLEWISTGVQSGTYHGRPPTNRRFRVPGASVLKITTDGLISNCVDYYDGLLLSRQLDDTKPA